MTHAGDVRDIQGLDLPDWICPTGAEPPERAKRAEASWQACTVHTRPGGSPGRRDRAEEPWTLNRSSSD